MNPDILARSTISEDFRTWNHTGWEEDQPGAVLPAHATQPCLARPTWLLSAMWTHDAGPHHRAFALPAPSVHPSPPTFSYLVQN